MLKKISRCVAGRPPLELSKKKKTTKQGRKGRRKKRKLETRKDIEICNSLTFYLCNSNNNPLFRVPER